MDSSILPNKVKAQNLTPQYVRAKQIEHRPLPQTIEVDGKQRSTTNSNGHPISATEEGVRNFWKWFGDSKVVDAGGKPLVVYHGTNADIEAFSPGMTKSPIFGKAIYFADRQETASGYAKGDGANVVPAFLKIETPTSTPQAFKQDDAFDGISRTLADGQTVYAVREGTQIKSAIGNSGQFDPANPNIVDSPEHAFYEDSSDDLSHHDQHRQRM